MRPYCAYAMFADGSMTGAISTNPRTDGSLSTTAIATVVPSIRPTGSLANPGRARANATAERPSEAKPSR